MEQALRNASCKIEGNAWRNRVVAEVNGNFPLGKIGGWEMSAQLTKEAIVEWLEKCDYAKCSDPHKKEWIEFCRHRLNGALGKLPVSNRIFAVAPESSPELGVAHLQHYFEIREEDGASPETAKAYKWKIRGKSVGLANAYLTLTMRTVARELAGPEYACDGIHNADGRKIAGTDRPVVFVDQDIVDRCGDSGNGQIGVMPPLSNANGGGADWDPDADVYGCEPSSGDGLLFAGVAESETTEAWEELKAKADVIALEKIGAIRDVKNCGACYFIMTSFDGDYHGIVGKTTYYNGAKRIREILLSGDRSLDLRRQVALRIQSFFNNEWWNDPANAKVVSAILEKMGESRKLAEFAAYDK